MKARGFTLIEILVVIAILTLLASMLVPAIRAALISSKRGATVSFLKGVGMSLQEYAGDFSAHYPPPDCINPVKDRFLGRKSVENSAHALCVYLSACNTPGESGTPSGGYASFNGANLLNEGASTYNFSVFGHAVVGMDDYVIDAFKNPIVYDERKSEGDFDGLNFASFVLISGGAYDRVPSADFSDIEQGSAHMFQKPARCGLNLFDTVRSDYENTVPIGTYESNDDIINK